MSPTGSSRIDTLETALNAWPQLSKAQVRVCQGHNELRIFLDTYSPSAQQAWMPILRSALQSLNVETPYPIQVFGRMVGDIQPHWQQTLPPRRRRRQPQNSVPQDNSASSQNPEPTIPTPSMLNATELQPGGGNDASPPAGIELDAPLDLPEPLIRPGWSFWCGWVVITTLAFVLASALTLSTPNGYFGRFVQGGVVGSVVGLGQWWVLRQEVNWAKPWLEATILGAIATGVVQSVRTLILLNGGFGALGFLLSPLTSVAVAVPSIVAQWWVLRRHITHAQIWLWSMAGVTLLLPLLRNWLPETITPLRMGVPLLLVPLSAMASGGVMVYLLGQSRLDRLNLNRYTDEMTRRRLVKHRSQINARFFLVWIALAIAGWIVARILLTILRPLVFPNWFSLSILLSMVALFQRFVLIDRVPSLKRWSEDTAIATFSMTLMTLILSVTVGRFIQGLSLQSTGYQALNSGSLPFLAVFGLGFMSLILINLSASVVQSQLLKKHHYPWLPWIGVHMSILLLAMLRIWTHPAVNGLGAIALFLLAPAATIVWILGYPKALREFNSP